jgi:transposase
MTSSADETKTKPAGEARVVTAHRDQPEFRMFDVEELIPVDHRARTVWAAVEQLDLQAFYVEIKSREGTGGRPALDPKVLLALWIYATSEGVGSARHLSRLCDRDHPYMWICGGLKPNYHDLSDFRVNHGDKLDKLLTQLLATLTSTGLLTLHRIAQDGTRVRASAGAASFRRASTIRDRCMAEAKAQIEHLRRELEADPAASSTREKAARERAAREREAAVARAMKELPKIADAHERTQRKREREARRAGKKVGDTKKEPRASTTDPEARVMKMGDGGFRPAYNMQFATDVSTLLIVGVDVTNEGTDRAQMLPMIAQIIERTGKRPAEYLVDGGYTALDAIDAVEAAGTTVYAPVPNTHRLGVDPHARKRDDTDRTAAWRTRMNTDDAKHIYGGRAASAELVHADLRTWRGLRQLPVRGRQKALAFARLQALTYNVLRSGALLRAA